MEHKVLIMTDSTCDIPEEVVKQRNIKVLPLYVHFGEETYLDGVTLTTDEMYELVKEKGRLPSSAAPSPQVFVDALRPYAEKGYDVLFIGIGAKLSGTSQNFNLAAQEFPERDMRVIDSGNLSSGIGILVLKACDLRDEGKSVAEIYEKMKDLPPKVHSQFVLRTLEYMRKGGRASGMQALLGATFRIKPVLRVRDGELFMYKKAMGRLTKGMDVQLEDFFEEWDKGNIVPDYLFVTHSQSPKVAQYAFERLKEHGVEVKHMYEGKAGCVISSHCGPGTIAIFYEVKEYDPKDSGRPEK